MEWDSVRFFLALARTASVKSAAHELGVDTSTVTRRIAALEESHGKLFERSGAGYVCTPRGLEMLKAAERIDLEMQQLARRLDGLDAAQTRVRVSCPTMLSAAVADVLRGFSDEHPHISLDLDATDARVDLEARRVDVVVRIQEEPLPSLVGRRVGRLAVAVFASEDYVARHPYPVEDPRHDWIGWDESYANKAPMHFENETFPERRIVTRGASGDAVFQAIRAGLGLGLLPALACKDAGLVSLLELPESTCPTVWVLSTDDRHESEHVRVVRTRLFDLSRVLD